MVLNQNVFNPAVNTSFNGIITYINDQYQNSFKNFIQIEPSSSSNADKRDGAYALINRTSYNDSVYTRRNWCSDFQDFPNFILSFTSFFVTPTFYSIESRNNEDGYYPKSWKIEGSLDKNKWDKIAEKDAGFDLEDGNQKTYAFDEMNTYKHFKFTQITGNNGDNISCLTQIEIFGKIDTRIHSFYYQKSLFESISIIAIIIMNK